MLCLGSPVQTPHVAQNLGAETRRYTDRRKKMAQHLAVCLTADWEPVGMTELSENEVETLGTRKNSSSISA